MKLMPGAPEDVGVHSSQIRRILAHAERWVAEGAHPALVLLAARHGVIFLHAAFGSLTPEDDSPPLPPDALFPLASISKLPTTTAAMILVEDGLLSLTRPVREYIPELVGEHKDRILVHHLPTHTAGLDDDAVMAAVGEKEAASAPVPPLEESEHPVVHRILHYSLDVPLAFPPGARQKYSDIGIYLLGEIVRRVSGKSLEAFARERIFDPLGMKDTFYSVPEEIRHRIVLRPADVPYAVYNTPEWQDRPSPSGGAYATAIDLAAFCQMFLNAGHYGGKRILGPATVAAMTRNQIPGVSARFGDKVFPEACWGFGWSVNYPFKDRIYGEPLLPRSAFNHGGAGGVECWIDPERDIVGVFFSVSPVVDEYDFSVTEADLFMNVVTAAVDVDGTQGRGRPAATKPDARRAAGPAVLRTGKPVEAGISPERCRLMLELAGRWLESGICSELILLVARQGIIALHEAFRRSEARKDAPPLALSTLFPLGPLTEPLTAAAALILVEEGRLGLNRPVVDYLPELAGRGKRKARMRIHNLLTHTSGFRDETLERTALKRTRRSIPSATDRSRPGSLAGDYRLVLETPLDKSAGAEMAPAASNYNLLGEIIARVASKSLADFAQERIFEPLGMNDTYFGASDQAEGDLGGDGASWRDFPIGSTGALSTALDMAVFAQMILNQGIYGGKRIFSPASVSAMTSNWIPGVPARLPGTGSLEGSRGYGWILRGANKQRAFAEPLLSERSFSQGEPGGCMLWVDPDYDLIAAMFCLPDAHTEAGQTKDNHDLLISTVAASIEAL